MLSREPDPDPGRLTALASDAASAAVDVPTAAVALALRLGPLLPLPGAGETTRLWESLATIAAVDLAVARTVEPHLDARAILTEAGLAGVHAAGSWGVYAAEGAGQRLEAARDGAGWTLTGTKPWCSLGAHLSHALVTAWVAPHQRALFAVDLRQPGVHPDPSAWVARGLVTVPSGPVTFDAVPADPVGDPGWYLARPGFVHGGLGVAAIWYGGAVGLARRLHAGSRRRAPDQVALLHLGTVDSALHTARTALLHAATEVDAGRAHGEAGSWLALRARQVVADASEQVLRQVDHALGPAPLALEDDHARRVDDLRLYLRQHHAERDLATLGGLVAGQEAPPW